MKLRSVKSAVKAWHSEFVEKQKLKEEKLPEEIGKFDEEAENSTNSNLELDRRYNLRAELFNLYMEEERNLIQKSKLNWIRMGDENTRFFHCFLAAKKRRNLIS